MEMSNTGSALLEIPEREFGSAPWWAWMGKMSTDSIDRSLNRFMEMEIYELIPIPLYGLVHEYMGREYLDLYRHTCRRCREWGIKLWIYDEFNWPSGSCSGRVIKKFPELRQQVIRVMPREKRSGSAAEASWEIVTHKKPHLSAYGAEWADETAGYPDLLSREAVRAYIDMTHGVYKEEIGEYFGDVVVGFFTDEPQAVAGGLGLPYTPGFFDMFRERCGYDLRPRLGALVRDEPDKLRVRRDYWGLVADLFGKNYFNLYADWCSVHNLKMTGHMMHEEILASEVHRSGDFFAMLSEMHVPGIDLLRGVASFDAGRIIPAERSMQRDITGKLVESIGYFGGKERTMCEAFGCMPHSSTLVDLKRAVDFLFHHGLSMINDNLFSDSLSSFRKFGGCHAFHTPWVRHYNILSRHIRTMSWLNSGSRLSVSVGLYYPGIDARARYAPPDFMKAGPGYFSADWDATQGAIHELSHGLLRLHWDYYLVFDRVLQEGRPVAGGLRMKEFDCRAMIFPDIHYVDVETGKALRRFVKSGGVMLCFGRVPKELDESGRVREARWGASSRVVELHAGTGGKAAEAARELERRLRQPVKVSGAGAGEVMATRRKTRAGEALMLTNFGERAADVSVKTGTAWRKVDTVTGRGEGFIGDRENLAPGESRLFIRAGAVRPIAAGGVQRLIARFSDEWEFKLPGGNVISLPLSVYTGKGSSRPRAGARAGAWTEPRAEAADIEFEPERPYWLGRNFEISYRPKHLELAVDGCDICEVFVNGRRVPAEACRQPVWDDGNLCCDLRRAVCRGRNELLIKYTPARIRRFVSRMVPLTDLPPFVMRGDFLSAGRIDRADTVPEFAALPGCVETGPLQPRGYPGFAGVAEYIQTVKLENAPKRAVLDMGKQNDLFEVEINGRRAGVLGWAPYRLEAGSFLKRGDNRFVFRMRTALGGILSRFYAGVETTKPPVGMLETPVLYAGKK